MAGAVVDRWGELERVSWRKEGLVLALLPALGGKLIDLRRIAPGRQARNVLYEPPERPHRLPDLDGVFEEHDASGFDECFPTVTACPDPAMPGRALPDHGAVWSRPVAWTEVDGALVLSSELPDACFSRTLRIEGETLHVEYEAVSRLRRPVLWSAHPLLAVSPGSRIFLPREVERLFVNWSAGERLGRFGAHCPWPGDTCRLDLIEAPVAATADKLFTDRLSTGICALHDRASDESVIIRFDVTDTPYVGLWICQGGWPLHDGLKHFTVALEPCSGRPDALDEAFRRGEHVWLEPGIPRRWRMSIELASGPPRPFFEAPPIAPSNPAILARMLTAPWGRCEHS